jgi:AcrR family transcriptional regulator
MTMSDRRLLRRQRTIDEVVATALEVMAETGAAGLSLGEVAKRMGMRPPSLYGYFASKSALCDELFARGWREVRAVMESSYDDLSAGDDAAGLLLANVSAFVGWALDHRAQAELMFWRPIQGWEPSPAAYAEAVRLTDDMHAALAELQRRGLLRADVAVEEMGRVLTVLSTGVISQQLSNEPGVPMRRGRYAADLGRLVAMFLHEFGEGR